MRGTGNASLFSFLLSLKFFTRSLAGDGASVSERVSRFRGVDDLAGAPDRVASPSGRGSGATTRAACRKSHEWNFPAPKPAEKTKATQKITKFTNSSCGVWSGIATSREKDVTSAKRWAPA